MHLFRFIAKPLLCLTALSGILSATTTDTDFGTIFVSKYYLNNNVWGKKSAPGSTSKIWNVNDSSPLSWGTQYDFSKSTKAYEVKAYLSVISGWHWGNWSKDSGLPVRLTDKWELRSSGSFKVKNPGVQNVAFDLWFHELKHPGNSDNPKDELMIWLASYQGAGPLGTKQGSVTIAGAEWDLYKGNVGWEVYSFVRKTNTESWDFDLRDFIREVLARKWMSPSKYITSVQFGTEIFQTQGQGRMDVDQYRVDLKQNNP